MKIGKEPEPWPDLWPALRKMRDGTPCWCVSNAQLHEGWIHSPVCDARRADRVLVIDDERIFRFPATYARNLVDATEMLFRADGWSEVWWDHDLGDQTTRVLAARLESWAAYEMKRPPCGRVVVHTANPVGRDWLTAALTNAYGQVEQVVAADWLA